ncbi:MAG: sugar ABC transporter permease [Clostridia bacterium]|nr:sugar ABC transporter permease [Clostridia bacterium]
MCLPAAIYMFCFCYMPMFGVVIAFKDYNYVDGILGSPWVGFEHFKFFFESNEAALLLRNTILYNVLFILLGTFLKVLVAILLYEITSRVALKAYQTSIILPNFISWVLVAYIGYALFSSETGMLNAILNNLGKQDIQWYSEPKYWPYILTIFEMWKGVGMGCIIYYAALMAVDKSLYEAAEIDGANRFKQITSISIPTILPTICILLIMSVGGILGGDFGLFFQLPRNSGALYPVTDVISTYVYRGLTSGEMSSTAAIGLFQNAVGLVLTLGTNLFVKKVNPENAMF